MRVSVLYEKCIINDFGVSQVEILGRMEVIEILEFLLLEWRNDDFENIGDFIDVIPWTYLQHHYLLNPMYCDEPETSPHLPLLSPRYIYSNPAPFDYS